MEAVSWPPGGVANGQGSDPCVTQNGRFVSFQSFATNLVPGDANAKGDIFVKDTAAGVIENVSVATDGTQANASSFAPYGECLSDSGAIVVFYSSATNLVPGDTNGKTDVFVRDRVTGATERVSVASDGSQGNRHSFHASVSGNGRYVGFFSQSSNLVSDGEGQGLFVRDRETDTTVRIGPSGGVTNPVLSPDGRFVTFASDASVIGGETHPNTVTDVFVHDRDTDGDGVFDEPGAVLTVRVSKPQGGGYADAWSAASKMSADGRVVAFHSTATNLVPGDTNGTTDVFVHDRDADGDGIFDEPGAVETSRVSVSESGGQANGTSDSPTLTRSGSFVAFQSHATNLVPGDSGTEDVFMVERASGRVRRVSELDGLVGNGGSSDAQLGADDGVIVFTSHATNLVAGDTNGTSDVLIWRPATHKPAPAPVPRGQLLGRGGRHARNQTALRADPVNTATGSYVHQTEDLSVPGPGAAFSFSRFYNSADTNDGPLGVGWTHDYNATLIVDETTGDVTLRGEDGQQVAFTKQPDGSFAGPPGGLSTLEAVGSGYTLTTLDRLAYGFDPEGLLTSLTDEAGNLTTLAYDPAGNLDTVTDAAGRAFSFTHDVDGHLVKVQAPDGRSVTFAYTGDVLTSATDVRGKTTTYQYDASNRLTKVIDPLGHAEIENVYGQDGRVVEQTDPLGNVATFAFDPATDTSVLTDALGHEYVDEYAGDALATPTDPNGNQSENTYDADLNLIRTQDALGRVTEMTYDGAGNLLSRRGPGPSFITESYTYDAGNHLTSVTDPAGNITSYSYDADGNLASETDPLGNVTAYAYDGAGNLVSTTDPRANTTTYEYDTLGNLTAETDPLGNTTTYAYDSAGRQTSMTDPRGGIWRTEYDAAGNVTAEIDPLGNRTEHSYDAAGNRVATKDPRGKTTTFEYNAADELVAEVDPLGNRTQYAYDEVGNQVSVTDPEGGVTRSEYDGNRNLVTTVSPLGNRTEYRFDAANRQVAMIDPRGETWASAYDENDRAVAQTDPLGNVTRSAYDANGNEVGKTDANGRTTRWEYDAASRLTAVVAPDGTRTEYEYDAMGNQTRRRDANGHLTRWEYDAASRRTAKVLPRGERWTYEYDRNGNLVRQTDADGNATPAAGDGVTTFTFDAANRQTKIDYADDLTYSVPVVPGVVEIPHSEPTPDVESAYDAAGNRVEMRDGAGTETYAYDNASRLTSVTRGPKTLSYLYDRAGRVTKRTYPSGTQVSAAYDAAGRITQVSDGAHTIDQAYDPAGALSARTFSNGVAETRTYDAASRLTEIASANASGPLDRFTYAYDPVGNPLSVSGTRPTETYAYDALDRLTRVCFAECATDFIEWDYDPVGNRLSENRLLGSTTYAYDASDRLVEERPAVGLPVTYGFDENGNQIRRGDERFAYDAADRHAAHIRGPVVDRYRYDGEGKRLSAETLPVDQSAAQVRTDYLWDPNAAYHLLVEETEKAGPVATDTRTYAYAGTDLLALTNDPATADPATRFVTHDAIGSVRTLTDTEGAVNATYGYEPFGVAREADEAPGSSSNPARFTGEYLDARSGLYHLRARDYDARAGRFLRPDPLSQDDAAAVTASFGYVSNRPTIHVDPSGLRGVQVGSTPSAFGGGRSCQAHGKYTMLNTGFVWDVTAAELRLRISYTVPGGRPCSKTQRASITESYAVSYYNPVAGDFITGQQPTIRRAGKSVTTTGLFSWTTPAGGQTSGGSFRLEVTVKLGKSAASSCAKSGVFPNGYRYDCHSVKVDEH
ncbi:MAG: PD40 domain-containing protein [Actinobacteria bacterium]|nr:PD40 domain-containing protein [Actinomycetota bacterium]